MNKILFLLIVTLFPLLAFADNSMTFAPPVTDYSVGFLANIFGMVDGVLHGTGSQIMGSIFEVFNAAVMALGGIIVTYTMILSTMNTAHEGEMLGKKWNSIWVPVRATAGFALLVPKASGFCLLQIFVMWVVVQGIGAADKLWNAALSYLDRGGVIVQEQVDPTSALLGTSGAQNVTVGAMVILSGQVCMLGLQQILQNTLQSYQANPPSACQPNSGVAPSAGDPDYDLYTFCQSGAVPNFTDTVDIIGAQNMSFGLPPALPVRAMMPSFPTGTFYSKFNGICGMLSWDQMYQPASAAAVKAIGEAAYANELSSRTEALYKQMLASSPLVLSKLPPGVVQTIEAQFKANAARDAIGAAKAAQTAAEDKTRAAYLTAGDTSALTPGEAKTALSARATAIQQMYSDLLSVAQIIINNDAQLTPPTPASNPPKPLVPGAPTPPLPVPAVQPFGMPMTTAGQPCTTSSSSCTAWGASAGNAGAALLTGTELQAAVLDYTGVMTPTLELMAQGAYNVSTTASKQFIQNAEAKGWLMAGSYFFDLVSINAQNRNAGKNATDVSSGLDKSSFSLKTFTSAFSSDGCSGTPTTAPWADNSTPEYPVLCNVLKAKATYTDELIELFTGAKDPSPPSPPVSLVNARANLTPASLPSTVFGYLQNALLIQLPGQQGEQPLVFANILNVSFAGVSYYIPWYNFPCGGILDVCLGRKFANAFYNYLARYVLNWGIAYLIIQINKIIMEFVMMPLQGFATIFLGAVQILALPGINPIIALANMGTYYINFVGNLWQIMLMDIATYVVTLTGWLLIPFFIIALPIMTTMAVLMLGIGFITAYYTPFIPYMIFTFGSIAWFMAVIEAMVAAPIMALGIIHPEGQHEVFGKSEQGVMILMNVFLRPAMMIIGYIAAISLTYVGVWILNAGFNEASQFMGGAGQFATPEGTATNYARTNTWEILQKFFSGGPPTGPQAITAPIPTVEAGTISGGYTGWAGIFAYFFSILIYTSMYMTIVEKAFGLISNLPDKVLRWIGGSPEQYGEHAAQWGEQVKAKIEKGAEAGEKAVQAVDKQIESQITGAVKPPSSGGVASKGGGAAKA